MESLKKEILPVPDYLRLTPVNLNEDMKYPYDRPDLWSKIQYLPDKIAHEQFYIPEMSSTYEKTLAENLNKLSKAKRSARLDLLKKNKL